MIGAFGISFLAGEFVEVLLPGEFVDTFSAGLVNDFLGDAEDVDGSHFE
jgi:hypothetical protein